MLPDHHHHARRRVAWAVVVPSVAIALSALTPVTAARAFTIESQISSGCHEGITTDALRAVRRELKTAGPLARSGDDGPLIDDLPFGVADDMQDIGGASLLIGMRDNDLKGRSAESIDQLIEVHGDPNNQREHCLRTPTEDEPDGSAASVLDCRAFIREHVTAAIDGGLDANGAPDASKRILVNVYLSFAGKTEAPLPMFYIEVGRAIHALQDSFAHNWRTADGKKVTVALNWVEFAEGTLVESRDGPEHRTPLDACDDKDALRTQRHGLAVAASAALLRATLDPSLDRAAKLVAVDAVLDQYLSYQPGCTSASGWCDAPERTYQNASGCVCDVVGGRASGAAGLALIAIAALGLRRKTRIHVA